MPMGEHGEVAIERTEPMAQAWLAEHRSVSPACDERVNAARKFVTEFIDIGWHVIVVNHWRERRIAGAAAFAACR